VSFRTIGFLMLVAALGAVACGSDTKDDPQVLRAGQVDIRLPDGWKVTDRGAERPRSSTPSVTDTVAAGDASSSSSDTVPLAKQDPTTAFFGATQKFRSCLQELGTSFIGAPDQSNPDSPTNDPEYIKDLSTCAAKSGIVQAMQDMQKAQEEMTPAEIEEQNKSYLKWRTCMIGKGWKIGKPTPDEKGRLFSFSGGRTPDITPPPGKDILGDEDMRVCAEQAQA
jgi:hypothetical protein